VIYRRRLYRVDPARADAFTRFFEEHLMPLQMEHGAELIGRWISEDRTQIMALWRYRDRAEYEAIERRIEADPASPGVKAIRRTLEPLFVETSQDFWTSTGDYHPTGTRGSTPT
jgi:hypothetical protein